MNFTLILHNIRNNWNLFRLIRLGVGILIIVEGFRTEMWMLFGLGLLFSLLPLLNLGSCSTGNCAVPPKKTAKTFTDELDN